MRNLVWLQFGLIGRCEHSFGCRVPKIGVLPANHCFRGAREPNFGKRDDVQLGSCCSPTIGSAPAGRYNQRGVRRGLCLLTLLGLLATPTGSALGAGHSQGELGLAAIAGLDPRQLVLRLGDLPPGFAVSPVGTGFVDNAQAAAGGPADLPSRLQRWGRLGGYQVRFSRPLNARTLQQGPLFIASEASVYRTARGAAATFSYTVRFLIAKSFISLPVDFALGADQARAYVVETSVLGLQGLRYLLVWRKQRVVATLSLTGRFGVVSAHDLASPAKKQEAHIARTLARSTG